jgi:predicted O-linked N-acetylglucosamine transferase (SPINDLY family)
MPALAHRLTDPHLDPPDSDLSVYVEKTVWLPVSYWCYCPPQSPAISELPALSQGHVTLGSLNSFAKVSPSALDLWRQILESVPNTRLLLHCAPGRHLDLVRQRFGSVADRVDFVGRQSFEQYLLTYRRVDIALDPFPYGGGITTCDAMWMGVPVVTLAGNNVVGRGGRSILSNLGLSELIAGSRQEYVRAVSQLASDLPQLEQLRKSLRQRMVDSPLMDAKRFAQDMESAFEQMWKQWCAEAH